jgi:hypothetical protein
MKTLLATLALATAGPALALPGELDPLAVPNGVTAHIVDTDVCNGVRSNLSNNPRNIFANRRVFGVIWYMNSKREYVSFNCWHMNMTQRVPQSIAIIYTASKETLDAAAREELESAQAAMQAKQKRIRDSGFE